MSAHWRVAIRWLVAVVALAACTFFIAMREETIEIDRSGGRPVERRAFAWQAPTGGRLAMDVWRPTRGAPSDTVPVLLFSPGWGQAPASYDTLLRRLSARGYAILGVRHEYREPFNFATNVAPMAADLLAGLDFATRRHDEHDSVFAEMDLRRVGAFGHSFGGSIAIEACTRDARVVAAMDLDGSVFGRAMEAGAPCPVFLLMGTLPWTDRFRRDPPRFYIDRDQARIHEDMLFGRTAVAYWLAVRGLEHMSFTDPALSPRLRDRAAARVGLRRSAASTQALAFRYLETFFGRYLRASLDTTLLVQSPFAGTTLRRRAP